MPSTQDAASRRYAPALLVAASLLSLLDTGCTMRDRYGPDFKRFSREHPFAVKQATHHAGPLELTVKTGSVSEAYTVLGSQSFTVKLQVRVANRSDRPLLVDSIGAIMTDVREPSAVYFESVTLPPNGEAELLLSIPAGTTRLRPPVALVYRGARMDL